MEYVDASRRNVKLGRLEEMLQVGAKRAMNRPELDMLAWLVGLCVVSHLVVWLV